MAVTYWSNPQVYYSADHVEMGGDILLGPPEVDGKYATNLHLVDPGGLVVMGISLRNWTGDGSAPALTITDARNPWTVFGPALHNPSGTISGTVAYLAVMRATNPYTYYDTIRVQMDQMGDYGVYDWIIFLYALRGHAANALPVGATTASGSGSPVSLPLTTTAADRAIFAVTSMRGNTQHSDFDPDAGSVTSLLWESMWQVFDDPPGAQLITANPGFDTSLAGWTWTDGTLTRVEDDDNISGPAVGVITPSSDVTKPVIRTAVADRITHTAGNRYQAEVWFKRTGTPPGGELPSATVVLRLEYYSSLGTLVTTTSEAVRVDEMTEGWNQIRVTDYPENATIASVGMYFASLSGVLNTIRVDDFRLASWVGPLAHATHFEHIPAAGAQTASITSSSIGSWAIVGTEVASIPAETGHLTIWGKGKDTWPNAGIIAVKGSPGRLGSASVSSGATIGITAIKANSGVLNPNFGGEITLTGRTQQSGTLVVEGGGEVLLDGTRVFLGQVSVASEATIAVKGFSEPELVIDLGATTITTSGHVTLYRAVEVASEAVITASGGKVTFASASVEGGGEITAHDLSSYRLVDMRPRGEALVATALPDRWPPPMG